MAAHPGSPSTGWTGMPDPPAPDLPAGDPPAPDLPAGDPPAPDPRGHRHGRPGRPPHVHLWHKLLAGDGRLQRSGDQAILGGVAVGVAGRIGRDVTVVRVVLLILGLVSGIGVVLYLAAWLVLPAAGADEPILPAALRDRSGLALTVALVPVVVGVLLVASYVDLGWVTKAWPAAVASTALVLVWRDGAPEDRRALRRLAAPVAAAGGSRTRLARIALALAAILVGGRLLVRSHYEASAPLAGAALVLAGLLVAFGPWWLRLGRDLVVERQARLRAEDRADLAARVHDSVLQTLTLVQRHADDPQMVAQLARASERELRAWLFSGRPPGDLAGRAGTVSDAVTAIQADVEAAHGVPVEAVVVGDTAIDASIEALLAAGREATVNAAKWSGATLVSLFVEVEGGGATMYVRDRGRGFDRVAVAADRRGVSESIEGRMARCGGRAVVRSAPGQGTEVELWVPLG